MPTYYIFVRGNHQYSSIHWSMQNSASWQAWRSTVLPAIESILGRPLLQVTARCSVERIPRPFQARQARFVSLSHLKKSAPVQNVTEEFIHKEIRERKNELDGAGVEQYPRIVEVGDELSLKEYVDRFGHLEPSQKHESTKLVQLSGRVSSIRRSGSKLAFIDICEDQNQHKVQLMLNLSQMEAVEKEAFSNHVKLIMRGDVISARGIPTRTSSGELSLLASSLPKILSPCLHRVPLTAYQSQTTGDTDIDLPDRHVEMLTDPSVISIMMARSRLIKTMRNFFDSRDFLEVQTPILAAAAGGATARPFETTATEFSDRKLWLRIAPELWLKRLVLGGMSRIYEIGPSFRNEGLDKTHNPEFTTCEFYATYHTLTQLQRLTESLLHTISLTIKDLDLPSLKPPPSPSLFANAYPEIDFVPALNNALGHPLPNLATPTAQTELIEIFRSQNIPLPSRPTLPRLLDKLSAHYLEPQCQNPTWIINTPECLSPLAKSFIHPTCPNDQPVAARAELFIHHRELVNCYEEENSPFEQRRKFLDQQRFARVLAGPSPAPEAVADAGTISDLDVNVDDEAQKIDHDYLRALEWGLPPTGGWGCGVDRLVMLFTGKDRITDVLSFGNLRAVTRGAERYAVKRKE